ncbi:unnamed protein product, partial [Symbiodinium microadriaticum]
MARTSFTRCNDCKDQGFPDCRYSERRTEKTPRAAVTASKSAAFTFRTTHTPNIELMYTLPATPRDALQVLAQLALLQCTYARLNHRHQRFCMPSGTDNSPSEATKTPGQTSSA